ncbi:MAG: DNA repair protein RecN [Candidatus Eisenbacteria bacterium]
MLRSLSVSNYAIIDRAAIDLRPGLTVLTGETGAGKSIIVGALSFVLGERVSDDVIRKGADSCRIEASFDLAGGRLGQRLEDLGLAQSDTSEIIVVREITRGGKSRSTVNGKAAAVGRIRDLGNLLVDFHGQHEHQRLLHPGSHVDFLDGFAHLLDLKEAYSDRKKALSDLAKRVRDLEQEIADINSREDFIRYEIREIEQLDLREDEDVEIERDIDLLEHAEKIIEAGREAMDALYDSDDAAIRLIARARTALQRIAPYFDQAGVMAESLDQSDVIVQDVAQDLRDHLSRIDLDSSRLETLRDRRAVIERVKRKYGGTVADVLDHLRRIKTGVDNRGELELELSELISDRDGLEHEVVCVALDLSARRKSAAKRFEKLIQTELKSLGIEGGGFKVVFEDLEEGEEIHGEDGRLIRVGENGMDDVEFFVRTNPGEDLLPLRRIASGGEISRVMLALKKILADVDEVDTLVFDEIDSGIGGSIADVIAQKLSQVAQSRQVICITHLAQIAGPAELHLAVGKVSVGGRTVTGVTEIKGEARVREMARMIGGRKPPESARLHAEEILKRSVAK